MKPYPLKKKKKTCVLKILTASKHQCYELSATSSVWYNSSPLSSSSPPLNFTFADACCICLRPLKGYNPSNHLPLKRHKVLQNAQSGNLHPAVLNTSCPTQQTSAGGQKLEFNSWKECQNTVYWTPIFISRAQDKSYQGMNWLRDKKIQYRNHASYHFFHMKVEQKLERTRI